MKKRVIVVGAGIIGATTALQLTRAGMHVTICDGGKAGGQQAASYGNGGWISPASIIPMSMPGLWKQVPGFLLDKTSPLTLDWKSLHKLTPWLVRFLLAGFTKARAETIASKLSWLLNDTASRHIQLAQSIGQQEIIVQNGLIYAYPDRAAFEAESFSWKIRRDHGIRYVEWDEATIRENLPAIDPKYKFAVHALDGAHCTNTGLYVQSIVDAAVTAGAIRISQNATTVSSADAKASVTLQSGEILEADYVVIAAGIHSSNILKSQGLKIPMASERGYHVTIPGRDIPFNTPVMPSTGKMANTPTQMGLRLAGQVELATVEKAPNWNRSQVLLKHALATYPYLKDRDLSDVQLWMGHRPSTADCLPVIGKFTKFPRLIAAFGHGHTGIAAAPKTAELVQLAINDVVDEKAKAYTPARFGH